MNEYFEKEMTLKLLRIRNMLRVILFIAKKHCFRYAFHYVISGHGRQPHRSEKS